MIVNLIPPLKSGERLSIGEFERRYAAMPELKKAELIEGVVYVPSPVRSAQHGEPHADVMAWLGYYRMSTPGLKASDNATLKLDEHNEFQPDAVLMIEPHRVGLVRLTDEGYLQGAVELAVEVAASSTSVDLHAKREAYRRAGILEYLVWRVLDKVLDWFVLSDGEYARLELGAHGYYQSQVFPGLWLDPAAMIRSDLAEVRRVLDLGVATPEHAAFVARLDDAAKQSAKPAG